MEKEHFNNKNDNNSNNHEEKKTYYIGKHIRFTEPNQKINKCVYN